MGDSTETASSSAASPAPPAEERVPEAPAAPPARPLVVTSAPSETVESRFWLTRGDQLIFGLLSFVAIALMGIYWVRLSNWGTHTVKIERLPARQAEFRLDANLATWVEWSQLQGIGDGLARRIVADRQENGPFKSVDDLGRVKGIGPKTLEHLRPWVRVNGEEPSSEPSPPPRKRARKRATQTKNRVAEAPAS